MNDDARIAAIAAKHGASPEDVRKAAADIAAHFHIAPAEALDAMDGMCVQPVWTAYEAGA
jgi:hypothetical protein